jgi:hypothetical protein
MRGENNIVQVTHVFTYTCVSCHLVLEVWEPLRLRSKYWCGEQLAK